jgi:hypothetical protein
MKKIVLMTGILGLAALTFTGCQKDPLKNLNEEESRIYVTNYDSTVNFASFHTFSIVDSVGVIENGKGSEKALTSFDAAIIDAVKSQLQTRGYQLVNRDQNPDLGINVSRVYSTSSGVVAYPSYWDYYGGFYDPYYWGFPGYGYYDPIYYGPYYYDYYQVTTGALSIDVLDLKDAGKENAIKPIWSALARGTGVFRTENVRQEINGI